MKQYDTVLFEMIPVPLPVPLNDIQPYPYWWLVWYWVLLLTLCKLSGCGFNCIAGNSRGCTWWPLEGMSLKLLWEAGVRGQGNDGWRSFGGTVHQPASRPHAQRNVPHWQTEISDFRKNSGEFYLYDQSLSQDLKTVCQKLAILKFMGILFFRGDHSKHR